MKTRPKLSDRQLRRMRNMLAELTPAERAILEDPDFITEDEADIIVSNRRMKEPVIPLDEVLAELGVTRRRRQRV